MLDNQKNETHMLIEGENIVARISYHVCQRDQWVNEKMIPCFFIVWDFESLKWPFNEISFDLLLFLEVSTDVAIIACY